jgi:hypothetical protein
VRRAIAATLLAAATAAAGEKPAPVAVHLRPIEDDVVQGLPVEEVEAALRKRLAREKGITLVPNREDAAIVLSVSECLGWGEKRRINEADERNVAVNPDGRFKNFGSEGAYGTRTEKRSQVSLVVRATWPEHFQDLHSADGESSLKSAADSVADQLGRLVKRSLRKH